MEFYITFIKALTLRLDETTVGFFFNEVKNYFYSKKYQSFPLIWNAI